MAQPEGRLAPGIDAGQIWLDGRLVPQEEATVSVLTHALHYGTSVFEGTRVYPTERGAAIFRLQDHDRRLLDSARILGMRPLPAREEIDAAVIETVRANERTSCYVRPLLWFGPESLGVSPARNSVHMMVATWPWGTYLGDEAVARGAKLITSSWRRSPPDVMPTKAKAGGNYVNSVLANMEARELGYDEALLLDKQGFVAEGSGENIFLVRDGVLYPVVHSVNLRGITRDSVIHLARAHGVEVRETWATRDELYSADEVFMVGTAAEVTPIAEIDRRPIGEGKAGPFAMRMREWYLDAVHGRDPRFEDWLTYVS
ncbi:MAG: branched-chain amino acid transaminase [Deinococcus-Thermus bacterium]|jgi:branched-chain amino acid aminotransferase|nr:branched-chain amino acid transaminase [Deinococcota bacterium]